MHNEFMAFIRDEETTKIVRNWADKQGFPADTIQSGGPELFASLLESHPAPRFAFVDFDEQEDPVLSASRIVGLCGPASSLVGIGTANDVSLFRGLINAGMTDYLVKPIMPEALSHAFTTAAEGKTGLTRGEVLDTRNIVFIGVRGGIGASTLATNVAWTIAHQIKKKVALLDLDLQYGTSALALDIEPGHGFRDVLNSSQRVDGLMIAGALVNESDMLAIMSAEESIEDILHIDPNSVTALLKEMRSKYRAIIIDLPRHLLPMQKRLLATAHEIILVSEMSLVGIRDTLRIRSMLKNLGATGHITQVVSKIGPNHPPAVDEQTFIKGTQAKIDFTIPEDHKAAVVASNSGKMIPIIAPTSPLTKSILALAHYLSDEDKKAETSPAAQSNSGLFGGIFGGGKKEASKG